MDRKDGVVEVRNGRGLRAEISVNGHVAVADEPANFGGTDSGPTPYDYLLGALGACTAMTVRMYADRKGWPLESVTVRLAHDRIHAEDCENCETKKGRIDRVQHEIELTGSLDDAQREKLLEIAEKCPVRRTLTSEMLVEPYTVDRAG